MPTLQFAHRYFRRMLQAWLIYRGGTGTQSLYFVGFLIKPNFTSWSVIDIISPSKSYHSLPSLQTNLFLYRFYFFIMKSVLKPNVFLWKSFSKYNCVVVWKNVLNPRLLKLCMGFKFYIEWFSVSEQNILNILYEIKHCFLDTV